MVCYAIVWFERAIKRMRNSHSCSRTVGGVHVVRLVDGLVHPVADAREAPDAPEDHEAAQGGAVRDRHLGTTVADP